MSHNDEETLPYDSSGIPEQIAAQFRKAWQQGESPAIDTYLRTDAPQVDRRSLLVALVQVDLEWRLKTDASVRVETYLDRYPALASDTTVLLDLISTEYAVRMSRGRPVTPAEYEQRFPQFGTELSSRLKSPHRVTEHGLDPLTCPVCKVPVVSSDEGDAKITCQICGNTFRVSAGQTTESWAPDSLPMLGKFQLLEQLGQGGFGTVYRAKDTSLGRIVAIKIPRSDRYAASEHLERFEREARSAASLEHPGIVRVLEFSRGEGFPYIVSEYVHGITLADMLTGRRFAFRETAQIMAQVAEALEHAHQRRVVHRDVKPSNIMLALDGDCNALNVHPDDDKSIAVRLMDFGLARREDDDVTVTVEGQVLGTYAYLSPEQARGEGHRADGRTDVYSLGVVLYQLLAGERPFRGNRKMLLHQVIYDEPRPPRKLNDQIPRDLETITLRCMAKDVDRRYRTAGEVAADLRRWLAGEPVHARPVRAPERFRLWCRRHPAITVLSTALLFVFLCGFGGVTWQWLRAEWHQREATRHFRQARDEVDTFLIAVADALRYQPGAQLARERLLQRAADEYERFAAEHSDDPELQSEFAKAYIRLGDVRLLLNELDKAETAYGSAFTSFDDLSRDYPRTLDYQLERANSRTKRGIVLHELGRRNEAEVEYLAAAAELKALAQAAPDVSQYRDGLAACLVNVSRLHRSGGKSQQAELAIDQAVQVLETLVESSSDASPLDADRLRHRFALASARNVQGVLLQSQGRDGEAESVFQQAETDFEALGRADPNHPDYAQSRADTRLNRANSMQAQGRDEEAWKIYESAIRDYEDLSKALPDVPVYREDMTRALTNVGQLFHKLGRNPEAKDRLIRANDMATGLIGQYPLDRYYKQLVSTQVSLAQVARDLGDLAQAEALLHSAIETVRLLAQHDSRPEYDELHAVSVSNLGRVLHAQGKQDESRSEFDQAIQRLQTLAQNDPQAIHYRDELAWSYAYRGDLLLDMEKPDEAAGDYAQVLALRRRLVKDSPEPEYRYNLAWFLANCPDGQFRDAAEAIQAASDAKDLSPNSPTYWNSLGVAHYRASDWKACIQALDQAVKLRSGGHCLDGFFRAMAHWQTGDKQGARAAYEQAVEWMDQHCPENAEMKRHRQETQRCLGDETPSK